ncbi:MAG: hypothetical protein OHK0022_08470 [Roseiflexaceae bacterium]
MIALIQIVTITLKELRELISRPWQAITLIAGPLALMVCFGIGSDTTANPPRAIVVVPPGQEQPRLLRDYQRQFDQFLDVVAYSDDPEQARAELRRGAVEAVVILPPAPFDTIASGKQATIQVLYNQIDPLWRWVVPNFTQVMAGEINREIFLQTVGQQQSGVSRAGEDVRLVQRALDLAIDAAEAGDRVAVRDRLRDAQTQSDALDQSLDQLGPEAAPLRTSVSQLRQRLAQAEQLLAAPPTAVAATPLALRQQLGLDDSRSRVEQLATTLQRLADVPPEVVISPLTVDARNVARLEPDIVVFYAPAILALLTQHIAVSIGALAFVRERLSGSFDLYTVAPMARITLLLGKYLAYMLFTLVVIVAVVVLLLAGLNVPLLGSPWRFGLILLLLAAASVGLGLFLSLLSTSERQAVQFAMLALLGIVFFSGFTLPLGLLLPGARVLAGLLPATYGVLLFQDVMLRGTAGSDAALLGLAAIATVLFGGCFGLLHWRTRAR